MISASVIAGHKRVKDARKRAYDPAIHHFRKKMDARDNGVPADFVGGVPRPGHDGVKGTET
jgi:hypothetical protein